MRLLIATLLLVPSLALAQVPGKVGYQGRLLKADGTPESGSKTLTFAVFDAATGGNQLWTEDQNVGLVDGFYSVALGSVTAFGATVFDGSERYLQLTIGGAALLPRQKVESVPYAMLAGAVKGAVEATSFKLNGTSPFDSNGKLAAGALSAGAGIALANGTISLIGTCNAGEVLKAGAGGTWACAPDATSAGGGTTYTAGPGIAISSSNAISLLATCASGQVLKAGAGGAWACAADNDTNTQYTAAAGSGLTVSGTALSLMTCTNGQILKSNGTSWACGTDAGGTGTISAVNGTAPVTATTASGTATISMAKASATADGYLAAVDFAAFDKKRTNGGSNLADWVLDATLWTKSQTADPAFTSATSTDTLSGDVAFDLTVIGTAGGIATYGDFIQIDPRNTYRAEISAKYINGAGDFSAGVAAYGANRALLGIRYFIISQQALTQTGTPWMRFFGTIGGEGAAVTNFPPGTRFVKPVVNFNRGNIGSTRVSGLYLEKVEGGCRSGFTPVADGHLCIENGTIHAAGTAWVAIGTCKALQARVCTHNDMQQACGAGMNPYAGVAPGWYGDHARVETAGNTDDEYLTWNYTFCDNNNDGPAVEAGTASYPYRCCY